MKMEFSQVSKRSGRSEIRDLLEWSRKPGIISFGGGLPDPSLFPIDDLSDIAGLVLHSKGHLALQYGPTQGEPEMIGALIRHMSDFGETVTADQICVVSSSQQGLDLISLLLIDEGSPIILELPSYIGAIQAFRRSGADMVGISMDTEGMQTDHLQHELDRLAVRGRKPRFIYVIPDFQNPSGITLSRPRRQQLLRIGRERQIPIVEDSPYRELTFGEKPLPSLWSLSEGQGVIQLRTFSKILLPGMRLGWMVADPEAIGEIVKLKQSVDLCSPSLTQLMLASYIQQGKMKKTIEAAIACYRPKRDAMREALRKYMPGGVRWSAPEGGMFLWVTLPEVLDANKLLPSAFEHNVVYVLGRPFHCDLSGANTLRLNYSYPSREQIVCGIERLAQAIETSLEGKPNRSP